VAAVFLHANAGVSFFFILSGFVLTWSTRPQDGRAQFYRRRFARIYPSHAATWLVAILIIFFTNGQLNVATAVLNLSLLQSWSPNQSVFLSINGVSWSLACEAFFYACFPLLLGVTKRLEKRTLWAGLMLAPWLIVGTAYLAAGLPSTSTAIWVTTYLPATRLVEFCIGILLAQLVKHRAFPRISLTLGIGAALFGIGGSSLPGHVPGVPAEVGFVAMAVPGLALLIVAAAQSDVERSVSLLRWRPLVRLGEWSFAFYLVHELLIEQAVRGGLMGNTLFGVVAAGAILFIVSVLTAFLLYSTVERPAERQLRSRSHRSRRHIAGKPPLPEPTSRSDPIDLNSNIVIPKSSSLSPSDTTP